jgi:hypothetical protein
MTILARRAESFATRWGDFPRPTARELRVVRNALAQFLERK